MNLFHELEIPTNGNPCVHWSTTEGLRCPDKVLISIDFFVNIKRANLKLIHWSVKTNNWDIFLQTGTFVVLG